MKITKRDVIFFLVISLSASLSYNLVQIEMRSVLLYDISRRQYLTTSPRHICSGKRWTDVTRENHLLFYFETKTSTNSEYLEVHLNPLYYGVSFLMPSVF